MAEAPTWLRHTLEEIVGQIRRLLDVSGCAFQVVDFEAGLISPAAAWFASEVYSRGGRCQKAPSRGNSGSRRRP